MKYKIKTKSLVLLCLMLLMPVASSQTLSRHLYRSGGRVIMDFRYGGVQTWRLVLGGGGCIDDMFSGPNNLPIMAGQLSANDGRVGRVVQEVFWNGLVGDSSLSASAERYNMNQSGEEDGTFSPTVTFQWNQSQYWVRVWSVPRDQWLNHNEPHFNGKMSMMTEYRMLGDGALQITNHVYLNQWTQNGSVPGTVGLNHLQAWTPLSVNNSTFDSCAVQLNGNGSPTAGKWWKYNKIPFGHGLVTGETGYATVFHNSNRSRSALSLIYGKKNADDDGGNTSYLLNIRGAQTNPPMIAINPGLYVDHMDPPTYIRRTKCLVFGRNGLNSAYRNQLINRVNNLATPIIRRNPSNAWPVNILKSNLNKSGTRTRFIGDLL